MLSRRSAAAILTAALATGSLLSAPGTATPAGAGTGLIATPGSLAADDVTVDNTGVILVARGHVGLTYGAVRATADLLRLNRPARVAALSGHVKVTDPQGTVSAEMVTLWLTSDEQVSRVVAAGHAGVETSEYALSADQIVADRRSDRVEAQGHVSMFSAPDLIVAGGRASYDRRTQHAVVSGHAVVENKAGRVTGDWMELFRAQNRAIVHGPVGAEVYGATITAADATVDLRQATAVFTGHVVITRRQGTLQADRVTVLYETQRIIAVGATHATFTELGESVAP